MASSVWKMSGLSQDDFDKRKLESLTSFKPKEEYEDVRRKIHLKLQNPDQHGDIVFDGVLRKKFTDNVLSCLPEYFSRDGSHLFCKKVRRLVIRNIPLRESEVGLCERASCGARCVADLLRKNPNIEEIDLSNASFDEIDVVEIFDALERATKLKSLVLLNNHNVLENGDYHKFKFKKITDAKTKDPHEMMLKRFHLKLQKPDEHGAIIFDGDLIEPLPYEILRCLPMYFAKDGHHIFRKEVKVLVIRNVPLRERIENPDKISNGVKCVVALLSKNPDIEKIDLTNTNLNDTDTRGLLDALGSNTKLRSIVFKKPLQN